MINIAEMPEVIDAVNAIVNNRGTAEIKNEVKRVDDGIKDNVVVVEISRKIKIKK